MLRLHYSNRTEALVEALVRDLGERRRSGRGRALEPVHLVVPNRNMQRYVELGIAQGLGVAANLQFHRLERFVREWLETRLELHVLDRTTLEARVLSCLHDDALLARPEMAPARAYLDAAGDASDARDLRRVQLALRVAGLLEEYSFSRPDLLDAWSEGRSGLPRPGRESTEAWQRVLWQRVEQGPASFEGPHPIPLHRALRQVAHAAVEGPSMPELHVVGVSYVARVFQWAFAALAEHMPVHLYTLNPCMEFWEDVPSAAELRRRKRMPRRKDRHDAGITGQHEQHPHLEAEPPDTSPLVLWGRPGREHVHMLNDLSECDFVAAFRDPVAERGESLLTRIQQDVLTLTPAGQRSTSDAHEDPDPPHAIEVLRCPGVHREVEAVADRIWSLVLGDGTSDARGTGDDRPLRFNEIAVLVTGPDRDLYLPHVTSVFGEAWNIPHNVGDVPLTSGSRIAEAALLLLDLPFSRFSRPEVLDVVTHPAVRGRLPEVDPAEWVALCDRLGIYHGIDHAEHEDTYIERDVVNWDQGVRRLALGAFMASRSPDGHTRTFEIEQEQYLPEDAHEYAATELALLVRSLAADVRFARSAERSLSDWAVYLSSLLQSYLVPSSEAEEAELRRCLSAVEALAERDLDGGQVRYRVAAELARQALQSLDGGRGEYLADGVVVSTLVPMRAIPFRVVFVLGLGEGRFPSTERRDTMDLRSVARRPGDVTPTERDEYTFLETLLCARERLVLSYVGRDELTGDPIAPSPVLRQLMDVLRRGYLSDPEDELLTDIPLRRYDTGEQEAQGAPSSVCREAHYEARVRALGHDRRRRGADPGDLRGAVGPAEAVAALRAELGEHWEPLRMLLRLCPPPERPTPITPVDDGEEEPPTTTLRLSLAHVRRFLESPMQGWASAVLGIEEEEQEAPEAQADEPLQARPLDATVALRQAFLEATRGERELQHAYDALVRELEARGRWPLGPLAQLRARSDQQVFAGWQQGYARVSPSGEAPRRLRFGPGTEHGDADVLLEAIRLEMPDPRPDHAGHVLRVELTGRTQPLLSEERGSMVLVASPAPPKKNLRERQLRYALRGFFDHVALAAGHGMEPASHAAFVLYGEGDEPPPEPRVSFAPIDPADARQWLADRVQEMLGEPHPYLFPCDAVLRHVDRWDQVTGDDLVHAVDELRRSGGGQARFGPIPDAADRPAPDPDRALALAHRRFDALLERLREDS